MMRQPICKTVCGYNGLIQRRLISHSVRSLKPTPPISNSPAVAPTSRPLQAKQSEGTSPPPQAPKSSSKLPFLLGTLAIAGATGYYFQKELGIESHLQKIEQEIQKLTGKDTFKSSISHDERKPQTSTSDSKTVLKPDHAKSAAEKIKESSPVRHPDSEVSSSTTRHVEDAAHGKKPTGSAAKDTTSSDKDANKHTDNSVTPENSASASATRTDKHETADRGGKTSSKTTAPITPSLSASKSSKTIAPSISQSESTEKTKNQNPKANVVEAGSASSSSKVEPKKASSTAREESKSQTVSSEQMVASVEHQAAEKALEEARDEARQYTADEMAKALRQDVEQRLLAGLNKLSEQELRDLVIKLSGELNERSKWEAIRMNDFLRVQEDKWRDRFAEFAEKQRSALAAEIDAAKKSAKEAAEADTNAWREKEIERIGIELESLAQAKIGEILQQLKTEEADRTMQRLKQLEALQGQVEGVAGGLHEFDQYLETCRDVHKLSTIALQLLHSFEYGPRRCLTNEVAALQVAGSQNSTITAAVEMLPKSVHSPKGVATRKQIFERLQFVLRAARAAAYTPKDSGVAGHALGAVTSRLILKTPEDSVETSGTKVPEANILTDTLSSAWTKFSDTVPVKQWTSGVLHNAQSSVSNAIPQTLKSLPQSESQPAEAASNEVVLKSANRLIDDAEKAMGNDDLVGTIVVLQRLQGYPAAAVKDWIQEAEERLRLEQAMRIVQAELSCIVSSLY